MILSFDVALRATSNAALRLMLVGDGPLREALETQSTALGIRDRLLLPGSVPHTEMPHYLAALDICVIPHRNAYRSPITLF